MLEKMLQKPLNSPSCSTAQPIPVPFPVDSFTHVWHISSKKFCVYLVYLTMQVFQWSCLISVLGNSHCFWSSLGNIYLQCHFFSCCTPGKSISSWTHTTCMRWGILIPPSSFPSLALKRYSWTLWHDQTPEGLSGENWGHSSGLGPMRQTKYMWVAPDLPVLALAARKTQTSLVETVGNSVGPGCGFGPSNYFYSVKPTHSVWCNALPAKLQGGHHRIWGTQLSGWNENICSCSRHT